MLGVLLAAAPMLVTDVIFRLLGGTELLMPYMADYMRWIAPSMLMVVMVCAGMFFIRLDGSPTYAMLCEVVPTVLNVVLDWVFVFLLRMGIEGAAAASAISMTVGLLMVVFYLLFWSRRLGLYRPKFSGKAMRLYGRNLGYIIILPNF